MAKNKIPKNRSLNEMLTGIKEEITFENTGWDDEETGKRPVVNRAGKKQTAADFRSQFFTPDLQEKVGKILLDIKLAYYKDGIGDISFEVVKDGRNVLIKTVPKTSKKLKQQ
ncbi:MAG: hypothetical protein LKI76_03540 [Megasphaera sp.]|jgi:hypothetical protein|uniref:hypothetical protein n=1 Tax=Megasphaera sueciensis TaxID=349094 RepID=UPI003D003A64|nr:hypothetical protein [Megasphaera sp.]MCI1822995.1 hypothetical protein [Megasphaera sp.]